MDKIVYECENCKAHMRAKDRPGSSQFMDMELQGLQSFTLATIEKDKGRPKSTKDNIQGWFCSEEDCNDHSETGVPLFIRKQDAHDLVIKISINEPHRKGEVEESPRETLKRLFKYLEYLKEEDKYEKGLCWLSGGHEWKEIDRIPNG